MDVRLPPRVEGGSTTGLTPWVRTLIFAGWLPHFTRSRRVCLCLLIEHRFAFTNRSSRVGRGSPPSVFQSSGHRTAGHRRSLFSWFQTAIVHWNTKPILFSFVAVLGNAGERSERRPSNGQQRDGRPRCDALTATPRSPWNLPAANISRSPRRSPPARERRPSPRPVSACP